MEVEQVGDGEQLARENEAVAPAGRPEAEKEMGWDDPEMRVTTTVFVTEAPCVTDFAPLFVRKKSKADGGAFTVRVSALLGPVPGFVTVIERVPAIERSVAGMAAVSSFEFTKVVKRFVPFTLIADPETKWSPFTVRLMPPLPATTGVGDREVVIGDGMGARFVIVRFRTLLGSLPGLVTVMVRVPAVVRYEA